MIYRVMAVDDELFIAEGVAQMMRALPDWELDVEIATSAREAMALIEKRHFDLLIVDIQMPEMNGLELLAHLRARGDETQVIFLTAYAGYPYMREAVRLGSFDYVLKVDGMRALRESVLRALSQKERAMQALAQDARTLCADDARVREALVREVFAPACADKAPAAALPDFDPQARFLAVSASITGAAPPSPAQRRLAEVWVEKRLRLRTNLPTWALPLDAYCACWVLQVRPEEAGERVRAVEVELECAAEALLRSFQLVCDFALSRECVPVAGVQEQFERLRERAMLAEDEPLIRSETVVGEGNLAASRAGQAFALMEYAAISGDGAAFEAAFELLREALRDASERLSAMYYFATAQLVLRLGSAQERDAPVALRVSEAQYQHLGKAASALLASRREARLSRCAEVVQLLKRHIRANLADDLSLAALSEVVHLNASYLSRMFSRICGQTLTDYVTGERMRRAAQLLRATGERIQDIAALVGFENVSYFTNVFRKRMGASPQRYREGEGGADRSPS